MANVVTMLTASQRDALTLRSSRATVQRIHEAALKSRKDAVVPRAGLMTYCERAGYHQPQIKVFGECGHCGGKA